MDPRDVQVEPGAVVAATDGRLGTVDEVIVRPDTGELSFLVIRRGWTGEQLTVSADLIGSIRGRREVRLAVTRDEARAASIEPTGDDLLARAERDQVRIPLHEERLIPERRLVDLGELRVHKYVDLIEDVVRQPVTRDDLVIERVPINRPLEEPVAAREEGDWLVIPIMEEVLVVRKQLMLTEEVRIRKQQVVEEQEVREGVRRERIELEDATVYGVAGLSGSRPPGGQIGPARDPSDEPTAFVPTAATGDAPTHETQADDRAATDPDFGSTRRRRRDDPTA